MALTQKEIIEILSHPLSYIPIVISITALVFTARNFLRKSGYNLRADINTCGSIHCEDNYVSSITIENLKDRAVIIFAIYIKLGRNNYLKLEEFKNNPLIIKPYEVYQKEYGPFLFYSAGNKQIKLGHLLNNPRVVLSTTNGEYKIKTSTKKWRPEVKFFKNYLTAIVGIVRLPYRNVDYGSRDKFLVEFIKKGNSEVISLMEGDERLKKFSNFQLTKESLESSVKLELFLREQRSLKKISFDEIKVIDYREMVQKIRSGYEIEPKKLIALNFFTYHVIGRFYTRKLNKQNIKENKRRSMESKIHKSA